MFNLYTHTVFYYNIPGIQDSNKYWL